MLWGWSSAFTKLDQLGQHICAGCSFLESSGFCSSVHRTVEEFRKVISVVRSGPKCHWQWQHPAFLFLETGCLMYKDAFEPGHHDTIWAAFGSQLYCYLLNIFPSVDSLLVWLKYPLQLCSKQQYSLNHRLDVTNYICVLIYLNINNYEWDEKQCHVYSLKATCTLSQADTFSREPSLL